jgi:hypothetical protein
LSALRDLRRRLGRLPEGSPALTALRLGYRVAYLALTAYWRVRHPLDDLPGSLDEDDKGVLEGLPDIGWGTELSGLARKFAHV